MHIQLGCNLKQGQKLSIWIGLEGLKVKKLSKTWRWPLKGATLYKADLVLIKQNFYEKVIFYIKSWPYAMNSEVIHHSMKKLRLHIVSININLHQKFIYKCMCQIDGPLSLCFILWKNLWKKKTLCDLQWPLNWGHTTYGK